MDGVLMKTGNLVQGYRQLGLGRMIRSSIRMATSGELMDLLWLIRLSLRDVDLSLVTPEGMGLSEERSYGQSCSGGPYLERILNKIHITSNDSIIDLGSGKGGAIITLSRFPFKRIAGVEISSEMVKVAQQNFEKLEIENITLFCCDAGKFSELDKYNYIYMSNPFPSRVMEEVMTNIAESLFRNPREMTIIYKIPTCHDIIMKSSLFKHNISFKHGKHSFFIYKAMSSEPLNKSAASRQDEKIALTL
jgi:16S rRNA G966 N2-methylase RsmD